MKLVVIPSDSIEAYEKKGTSSWLEDYYNPTRLFSEVYVVSPLENEARLAYGMKIIPAKNSLDFRRLVKEISPDVIRAYGGYWASDYALANKVDRIPIIVSVHDARPNLLFDSVAFADSVVCMSKVVKDLVVSKGTRPDRAIVLGNRVNTKLFQKQENSSVDEIRKKFPQGKFILHIGRKDPLKNIETVIGALSKLDKECFAVFVGQGNDLAYKKLAEEASVSKRCFWVPSVPNDELPFWYNACDIFCVPSLKEGFGLVFIEAAACQSPIITSNIAPMNEYFENEKDALLVDRYQDPEAIAGAIKRIIDNAGLREKIRNNVRCVAEKFSKDKIDQKEAQIYRDVIKNKDGKYRMEKSFSNSLDYKFWKISFEINKLKRSLLSHNLKQILGKIKRKLSNQ